MHPIHLITSFVLVSCQHHFTNSAMRHLKISNYPNQKRNISCRSEHHISASPCMVPHNSFKRGRHKIDNQNKSSAHWLSFYHRGLVLEDGVSGTIEKPHEVI
ncbi:hypothetical protein SNK03_008205 [Fusarium graminearum]